MSNYTTGEMAKLCGVSVRTVQYYDTRGVLNPSALSEGGRRLYSESDLSKMKVICFLRELDLSLDRIAELMKSDCSDQIVSLILTEQEKQIEGELAEKQEQLEMIRSLRRQIEKTENFSVESIGDVAHIVKNKEKMKKLHLSLLLMGIPMTLAEWGVIALWIVTGIWWPFALYAAATVPFAIFISRYYFKRVAYICPQCHETFVPKLRQAFWANHTPTARKLTCPHCGYRGFCVETLRENAE